MQLNTNVWLTFPIYMTIDLNFSIDDEDFLDNIQN